MKGTEVKDTELSEEVDPQKIIRRAAGATLAEMSEIAAALKKRALAAAKRATDKPGSSDTDDRLFGYLSRCLVQVDQHIQARMTKGEARIPGDDLDAPQQPDGPKVRDLLSNLAKEEVDDGPGAPPIGSEAKTEAA